MYVYADINLELKRYFKKKNFNKELFIDSPLNTKTNTNYHSRVNYLKMLMYCLWRIN